MTAVVIHLVEVPLNGSPAVKEFSDMKSLLGRLTDLVNAGEAVQVFMFSGDRWHVTKEACPQLVTHLGESFPIINRDGTEIDETGTLVGGSLFKFGTQVPE